MAMGLLINKNIFFNFPMSNYDPKKKGKYLINTYDDSGIVNLDKYPKLSKYLHSHETRLKSRHVAKKETDNWFKTIDRVYEHRALTPKLLIPDIGATPTVVYDEGKFHPNNSIYYICSEHWDLHALKAVLVSDVTKLFISAYSTKIAKGINTSII